MRLALDHRKFIAVYALDVRIGVRIRKFSFSVPNIYVDLFVLFCFLLMLLAARTETVPSIDASLQPRRRWMGHPA